jgi:hypothetical protein
MQTRWVVCAALCSVWTLGIPARASGQSDAGRVEANQAQSAGVTAPPAEKAPEGLARLSSAWPAWLTVTLVDRVRVESVRPPAVRDGAYDTYLLNRFRLTANATMSSWAQATVQIQDSRAFWYGLSPVPKTLEDTFDLRLANVELTRKGARGVSAVVGRQELNLGDRRLIASSDWANVGRTYDGLRLTAFVPGVKVDLFGVAPVDVTPPGFSRPKHGERAFGAWAVFNRLKPLSFLDVYQLAKYNSTATGETGSIGDQVVYTTGVRAGGPIVGTVTFEAGVAVQRGHSAADSISAWATHEAMSWTISPTASMPKLAVEYDSASGDNNPTDGTKQTFDQIYATTHNMWGLADQVGWRNMHRAAVKFEFSPVGSLKVSAALNKLSLATVNDAWYGASGAKIVTNRHATSRDLGWEPDLFAAYTVNREFSVGAGIAVLLGGGFIQQSTGVDRIWTPYVMSTYKF